MKNEGTGHGKILKKLKDAMYILRSEIITDNYKKSAKEFLKIIQIEYDKVYNENERI